MTKYKLSNLAYSFLLLLPTVSLAKSDETPVRVDLGTIVGNSNVNQGPSALAVTAGTEKKVATFRIGTQPKTGSPLKFEFAIETPYDQENDSSSASLADFDGLANSTNIQLNVSWFDFEGTNPTDEYRKQNKELCKEFTGIHGSCVKGDINKARYCTVKSLDASDCANVSDDEVADWREKYAARREQLRGPIALPTVNIWGIKAKYGRENFAFNKSDSLEADDVTKSPWSITAYKYWKTGNSMWGLGAEYQESFVSASSSTICTPIEIPSNAQKCADYIFGEPVNQRRKLVFGEFRWANWDYNVAVAPKITYDFETDETGIQVPIYMLRNENDVLTGGISLGWQSETDEITASLIVGAPFSFF